MAPAPAEAERAEWRPLVCFGVGVVVLASLFAFLVSPLVSERFGLSWWKIFRRCVSVATCVSLWLVVRLVARRSFGSYGFASWRAGKRQLAFGALLGLGTLVVMLGLGLATGVCAIRVTDEAARLWRTVALAVPVMLAVSLLEELVFRGVILQHLMPASRFGALLASSGLYAAVHLKSPEFPLLTWLELGGLFLLGGVLALSYFRTGQLYAAVGLHAALAYGARVNKLLVQFPDPSMAWLSGTSRLVNGLAGWIALAGMGGVIWWAGPKLLREAGMMGKRTAGLVMVCALGMLGMMPNAAAFESSTYMEGATRKLGRGIANVVTSPLELIRTPELVGRRDGYIGGLTVGIAQGAWHAVARFATGAYDAVTFLLPVPRDFDPVLYPEFVWKHGAWAE